MRIVFASLGTLGDLHPLLSLAEECRARGLDVVLAASERHRRVVEPLGFAFHPIRPRLDPAPERLEYLSHPKQGPERVLSEEIFPSARETYFDLLAAAQGADGLVVGELLYVAPLVAAKLGIPWANVILAPSSFLSACDPCVLAPAPALHALRHLGRWPHRLIFALGRRITTRWAAPLLALRAELGLPAGPSPVFEGKFSEALVLACFPEFFAARQPDWPGAVVQTGFPFFAQSARPEILEKIAAFVAAGDAPLVFTLGSTAVYIARNFYEDAAGAARALGRRAILLMGNNAPPSAPGQDLLALDYAPLAAVVPHAAAVVHHGGVGTCGETLRAGVPSLVVPFGFDQPDNAERLRKLGVARVIRRRVTQGTLTRGLRDILNNPAMTVRAQALARQVHPTAAATADALIHLVRTASVPTGK